MNEVEKESLAKYIKTVKDGAAAKRAMSVILLEAGVDVSMTGYTAKHAQRLRRMFVKTGITVFNDKRVNNRERVLSKPERDLILQVLKTETPSKVMPDCTDTAWSTSALGRYIFQETGKKYKSKTSQYLLFKEAKFSFHCPGKSYEKTDPEKIDAWKKQQKDGRSMLQRAWRNPDTVILCGDEMVLTSRTTLQKIWLPQGQYPPVIESNGTRQCRSIYGFLNLKNGKEHAFMTEWQNMYITVEVLEKLRNIYPTQDLLLVWDNCGWHRGSAVSQWIKKDSRIKVLCFPPYSPELNPQEHVWKAGRKASTHNQHITDIVQTTNDFISHISNQIFPYELCGLRTTSLAQV